MKTIIKIIHLEPHGFVVLYDFLQIWFQSTWASSKEQKKIKNKKVYDSSGMLSSTGAVLVDITQI